MAYSITITAEAEIQLRALPLRDQRIVEAAIEARLAQNPATPTRAIQRLRPNPLVQFELRVGDLRVLYHVEGQEVILIVFGRKVRNSLIVNGEEFHGHQDDSTESTGS